MEVPVNLYCKEELGKKLNLNSLIIDEWEKAELLYPAGKYDKETSYYNEENLVDAEKIKALMGLGYDLKAIKQIKIKIGLPAEKSEKDLIRGKLVTVGEIAEKSGISARTLKYWEEKDLIQPDARSAGGFRLYRESFVEICHRIKELQLFGYTVEELKNMNLLLLPDERLKEDITIYSEEELNKVLDEFSIQQKTLTEKIRELQKAIKRWEGNVRLFYVHIFFFSSFMVHHFFIG